MCNLTRCVLILDSSASLYIICFINNVFTEFGRLKTLS